MASIRERWIHKRFTPADPSVWGQVDTWVNVQRVDCTTVILSAEQNIRAGRDTPDRVMRVYPIELKHDIQAGDYLSKSGIDWLVLSVMPGNKIYVDCKAVQG
jgi:hypothetical protein